MFYGDIGDQVHKSWQFKKINLLSSEQPANMFMQSYSLIPCYSYLGLSSKQVARSTYNFGIQVIKIYRVNVSPGCNPKCTYLDVSSTKINGIVFYVNMFSIECQYPQSFISTLKLTCLSPQLTLLFLAASGVIEQCVILHAICSSIIRKRYSWWKVPLSMLPFQTLCWVRQMPFLSTQVWC